MQVRVLTLPFSTALRAFDENELTLLQQTHELMSCREVYVSHQNQLFLTCVLECHPRSCLPTQPATGPVPALPKPSTLPPPARSVEQQEAFERIRAWRKARAESEGVPPYVLLTNRELSAIIDLMPKTREALGRVEGIGLAKLRRYGADILALIQDQSTAQNGEADTAASTEVADAFNGEF